VLRPAGAFSRLVRSAAPCLLHKMSERAVLIEVFADDCACAATKTATEWWIITSWWRYSPVEMGCIGSTTRMRAKSAIKSLIIGAYGPECLEQ
jgi:hypothetical protein